MRFNYSDKDKTTFIATGNNIRVHSTRDLKGKLTMFGFRRHW